MLTYCFKYFLLYLKIHLLEVLSVQVSMKILVTQFSNSIIQTALYDLAHMNLIYISHRLTF